MADPSTSAPASGPRTGPGKTIITDSVVAKIVGIAAREVPGVHALGGSAARALGALREAISGTDLSPGVSVTVKDGSASVAISIVVEYPHELQKVSGDVRSAIQSAIETIVGMQVSDVEVTVRDVHQVSDDDTDSDIDEAETTLPV
ncbi:MULTISPECIES: Asp23/Gls24 family envelope stress response protein [Cryobacterium]|uniref:Asp23/Gls24 family envelope stress response protein n=1 Tax=Cryobacterium breve TaxID=1259258 RepID=A0ABY2IU33_9MICO|nr:MULTISPECIES: Asp23/Gls24 family envelope stress response protein [Cryobacterium]TFC94867.1 Asp23/Gls24 family envelope stress response protein [Cryobacterium breve]TFC94997.1 Asp23/Gls24 family envelope stress response protein [Cryobacterium sp. TmT3-12]